MDSTGWVTWTDAETGGQLAAGEPRNSPHLAGRASDLPPCGELVTYPAGSAEIGGEAKIGVGGTGCLNLNRSPSKVRKISSGLMPLSWSFAPISPVSEVIMSFVRSS
jgi:hypothetical protein